MVNKRWGTNSAALNPFVLFAPDVDVGVEVPLGSG